MGNVPGSGFGRYKIVEKIACGGTAEVYKATLQSDNGFAKTVAIKKLLPSWDDNEAMLIDEANVLCHLAHQCIVQVYELGCEDGHYFIAMEYVDGIDCARLLTRAIRDEAPLPPIAALFIISQVLTALEFAHRTKDERGHPINLVHRDISPSNILLSWNGEVKVTDFGIAKGAHRTQLTDAGQVKGKYSYMAPEQAKGEPIDKRADIFACGIVLFELLTAKRLFKGATDAEVLGKVSDADFDLKPIDSLPAGVRAPVMLALAKDPDSRYQEAGEMLFDVRNAMQGLGQIYSSLEFAHYLRETFPEDLEDNKAPKVCTQVMSHPFVVKSPKPRSVVSVFISRWHVACTAILLAALVTSHSASGHVIASPPKIVGGRGDLRNQCIEGDCFGRSSLAMTKNATPKVKGVIAIDSEPSGAKGTFTLGDKTMKITTPFARSDIEISQGVDALVKISAPGFDVAKESFSFSPSSTAFVREIKLKPKYDAKIFVNAQPWGLATVSDYVQSRETPLAGIKVKAGTHLVKVIHPPTGRTISRSVNIEDGQTKRCFARFGDRTTMWCR
ncbi:MAG: serine/threonine-protein kinase [Pseudomonadota bacterium]